MDSPGDNVKLLIPSSHMERAKELDEEGARSTYTLFKDFSEVTEIITECGDRRLFVVDQGEPLQAPGWNHYPFSDRVARTAEWLSLLDLAQRLGEQGV